MAEVAELPQLSAGGAKPRKTMGTLSMVFCCGSALISDGYVNSVAGTVNLLLSKMYPKQYGNSQIFTGIAYLGVIVGQLGFGWIVDRHGRRMSMLSASCIMILGSALCAGAYGYKGSIDGMLAALVVYRFLTGIGIGAEYPSGSVACSEASESTGMNTRWSHMWFALATDCALDIGFVLGSFIPLVLVLIFGDKNLEPVWRLTFGLGIVPAALVLLWRLRMPREPEHYRQSALKRNVPYFLIVKRYWRSLLGVSLCWFIYDFIVYPFGLFSSVIVDQITGSSTKLSTVLVWGLVINAFYLPGCFFGALTVDWIKPKRQLIVGLVLQGIIGFAMSGAYKPLTEHIAGFTVVYGLFLSLGEFGPGVCLGLLASKCFPTGARGQMYGIAAAIGKVGAYVGVWAFPAIINAFPAGDKQTSGPFYVGSGLAFVSALVAFFFIKEVKEDGLRDEDEAFKQYLAENGYDITQMGHRDAFDEETIEEDDKKYATDL
ncbi:glycerophosphoinositol permease [Rhodotorula sphaerocarpa]